MKAQHPANLTRCDRLYELFTLPGSMARCRRNTAINTDLKIKRTNSLHFAYFCRMQDLIRATESWFTLHAISSEHEFTKKILSFMRLKFMSDVLTRTTPEWWRTLCRHWRRKRKSIMWSRTPWTKFLSLDLDERRIPRLWGSMTLWVLCMRSIPI